MTKVNENKTFVDHYPSLFLYIVDNIVDSWSTSNMVRLTAIEF